jgi:hypothetical protein
MRIITIVLLIFFSNNIIAQKEINNVSTDYKDLLYGVVYETEYYKSGQHPFFLENTFYKSSITFKGNKYENVRIKYDLYNQDLILFQDLYENQPRFIKLNSQFIDGFCFKTESGVDYTFATLKDVEDINERFKYYEIKYKNELLYVVGRDKVLQRNTLNNWEVNFIENQRHYLIKDKKVYLIKRKGDIYKALKERKKEIKHFVKQNNFKVSLTNIESISKLLKFYEEL